MSVEGLGRLCQWGDSVVCVSRGTRSSPVVCVSGGTLSSPGGGCLRAVAARVWAPPPAVPLRSMGGQPSGVCTEARAAAATRTQSTAERGPDPVHCRGRPGPSLIDTQTQLEETGTLPEGNPHPA